MHVQNQLCRIPKNGLVGQCAHILGHEMRHSTQPPNTALYLDGRSLRTKTLEPISMSTYALESCSAAPPSSRSLEVCVDHFFENEIVIKL